MADELSFAITTECDPVDPTGEPCAECGEVPYLEAFGVFVAINGARGDQILYLCLDCKNGLDDEDDDSDGDPDDD